MYIYVEGMQVWLTKKVMGFGGMNLHERQKKSWSYKSPSGFKDSKILPSGYVNIAIENHHL